MFVLRGDGRERGAQRPFYSVPKSTIVYNSKCKLPKQQCKMLSVEFVSLPFILQGQATEGGGGGGAPCPFSQIIFIMIDDQI